MSAPHHTELYTRLELTPDATEDEIVHAGRRLSRKWHPDKNPECREEAASRFKGIREAVEILSDPQRRQAYDRTGHGEPHEDAVGAWFAQARGPRHEPLLAHVSVSLENLIASEVVWFTYTRRVECIPCEGTGSARRTRPDICRTCGGRGRVLGQMQISPMMVQSVQLMECASCHGAGSCITDACPQCHGKAYVMKEERNSIRISPHLTEGSRLQIGERGHFDPLSRTFGDLVVVVHEDPHEVFTRKGTELHTEIELNLTEALFGFSKRVHHLDDRPLRLRYDGVTQFGTVRRVPSAGMTQRGDLVIRFVYVLPHVSEWSQVTTVQPHHDPEVDDEWHVEMIEGREEPADENPPPPLDPQPCRPM